MMCQNVELSIIIPVYNVHNYIERCVRSLMEQTMKDGVEFIFVNDCTPDGSIDIIRKVLEDYPERYSQVRVIENQHNLGIYRTRCIGAEAAMGKYLGWVDSDDWVEPSMFEKMLKATDSSMNDIVVCDYIEYRMERTSMIHFNASETPIESIMHSLSGQGFAGTLWNQIFRRSLFVEHMYDVVPTNYSEDTYIIWHVYCNAKSIRYIAEPLYHYDKRNQKSLMHTQRISMDMWIEQYNNLVCIATKKYSSSRDYCRSLHYFMFWRKYEYRDAFKSSWVFYSTFRRASWDIFYYPGMSLSNKLKIFIVNNCFLLFWIVDHKH